MFKLEALEPSSLTTCISITVFVSRTYTRSEVLAALNGDDGQLVTGNALVTGSSSIQKCVAVLFTKMKQRNFPQGGKRHIDIFQ
jgi:hypothetical protein